MKQAAGLAVFSVLAGLLISCSKSGSGRVYLVGESRVVSGFIAAQTGVDLKALKISLIDNQGQRTSPNELKYDSSQGSFSFQLRDSDLYEAKRGTALDRILSMGNALPAVTTGAPDIVSKVDKYTRVELVQSALADADYQVIPYFQGVLPLSRRNLMSGRDTISIGGQVKFSKAGFVRLKVVNEAGAPLQGIKVAGISQEIVVSDGIVSNNTPLWHETLLRPVLVTTDAEGKAFIGPIDATTELTRYQILAFGEGYCTYLSSPTNNFSLAEKTAPVVTLRACDKAQASVNELLPSFPEKLKYLDVSGKKVVHTKEDFVTVRLDSRTENLRGAKIALYETDSNYTPALEVTGKVIEASTFQAEFIIELPKIFKSSGSTDGKFIIKVSRVFGSRDGPEANAQAYPELLIYGHRKIATPSRATLMKTESVEVEAALTDNVNYSEVDDWTKVKISSVSGTTNIVPGTAGGTFTISSDFCGEGDSLGFSVPSYLMSAPVFKDCVNGVATFTAEEAGFIANARYIDQFGGRQKWRLFIRDKFGNVSDTLEDTSDPTKRLNILTVVVDVGRPVVSDNPNDLPLNSFEFFKDATKLDASKDGSGTFVKPLRLADIRDEGVTMRFQKLNGLSNKSTCVQTTATEDEEDLNGKGGGNATLLNNISAFIFKDDLGRLNVKTGLYEEVGLMIYKWMIGNSAASVDSAAESSYTRCRTLLGSEAEPTERVLKETDFVFNSGEDAVFYMKYIDVVGNKSTALQYKIPACASVGMGSPPLCWQD